MLNSLTLMLYLLVPWTALNLVDFFFVRRGHYAITDIFRPDGVYGTWGCLGLTAYFVGFAAEIPFAYIPGFYESWGATQLQGVDISWILGMIVGGGLYALLVRGADLSAERPAIERSERALAQTGAAR